MENDKRIDEMSIQELADMLMQHPEMADEIFAVTDNLSELYDEVSYQLVPEGQITDDGDLKNNYQVNEALKKITEYLHEDLYFDDWEQYNESKEARKKVENFQDKLVDEIAYGATPDELREYCELYGEKLEEWYDVDTLKSLYESYGYDYNPEDNSISKIVREKPQSKEFLDWLEGGSSLQKKEKELSALEAEAKTISEAEALVDKQNAKQGEQK